MDEIMEQLSTLTAVQLRRVILESKRLLKRKPLYIREIGKPTRNGRYIYLYATWQEDGKTKQKSLGRKTEALESLKSEIANNPFEGRGIFGKASIEFLQKMLDAGFYLAN